MGNDISKKGNKISKKGNKKQYKYTSIDVADEPLKYFMNPDNDLCIIVSKQNINIFCYDSKSNKFVPTLSTNVLKHGAIKDIIYNPYHKLLIYWTSQSTIGLQFTQYSYKLSEIDEYDINYDGYIQKNKIIAGCFLKNGILLVLVTNIGYIFLLQWNENTDTKPYTYSSHYMLSHCKDVICCDIHNKRKKMVIVTGYQHHWYLNIYSIHIHYDNNTTASIVPTLCISRLIYWNIKKISSILPGFRKTYKLFELDDLMQKADNGYSERRNAETLKSNIDGVKYVLHTFFGIDPSNTKLLFNDYGDKVLFQSYIYAESDAYGRTKRTNIGLHRDVRSYDNYGGYLNDFGPIQVVDISTGDTLFSVGSKSSDNAVSWMDNYLVVFKGKGCKFRLEGFESQTHIADCLYNDVISKKKYLRTFSYDLCLLIAVYRGTGRYYKDMILVKRCDKVRNAEFGNLIKYPAMSLHIAWNKEIYNKNKWFSVVTKYNKNKETSYILRFYDANSIAINICKKEDSLLNFMDDNCLICRDLTNPTDIFGDFLRN